MLHAVQYAFNEATTSFWRGRQSAVLSTATIAVALFVLGGFLLATTNLERLGAEWSRAAEMSVYLDDQATPINRTAVEHMLTPANQVAGYEFISKPEALKRFKRTFTDLATTLDAVGESPLPASYEVRLQPSVDLDAFGARLRQMHGVTDVRYDRQWLDRLLTAIKIVRVVGLVLGAVLIVAAALTVANVVRLALYARRDELDIMQLVGAPTAYIRGPFVMEGVLQGGVGALVALIMLAAVFWAVRSRYLVPLAAALNLSSIRFLSIELCATLLIGGMLVGCVGGVVAASGRT